MVAPTGVLVVGGARSIFLLPGGTVDGNIEAQGGFVALGDGAVVYGSVIQEGPVSPGIPPLAPAPFNVYFLSEDTGATVWGSVEMKDGALSAVEAVLGPNPLGTSTANYVDGDIKCEGGSVFPEAIPPSGSDWDGDGTPDGSIGGNYECP